MTDQTQPKKQYRQRPCPEGYVSLTGLCLMLGIDGGQARVLLRQKRLPEPIRVARGKQFHLYFSIDQVRGKMGAQTSLKKQRGLRVPTSKIHHTIEWVQRMANR